jgi:hypothetical protein
LKLIVNFETFENLNFPALNYAKRTRIGLVNLQRRPVKSKLFLVVLSSVLCNSAWADWIKLGSSAQFDFYADPSTLGRSDEAVSIWTLNDFYKLQVGPSKEKYQSTKVYFEFKCQENMARQAYLTRHLGLMGGAGALSSDAAFHEWLPVMPGTVKAIIFKYACNSR